MRKKGKGNRRNKSSGRERVNSNKVKGKFRKQRHRRSISTEIDDELESGVSVACNDELVTASLEQPVKLAMWDTKQCDPKRCTGQKLVKKQLLKVLRFSDPFQGIVLSPTDAQCISPQDRRIIQARGLAVIDCSWKRVAEAKLARIRSNNRRSLPFLMACNPVNYGKPYNLSCAEAIVAALYIVDCKEQAYDVLDTFDWGREFMRINHPMLQGYCECNDHGEVEYCSLNFEQTYANPEPRPCMDLYWTNGRLRDFNPNRQIYGPEPIMEPCGEYYDDIDAWESQCNGATNVIPLFNKEPTKQSPPVVETRSIGVDCNNLVPVLPDPRDSEYDFLDEFSTDLMKQIIDL